MPNATVVLDLEVVPQEAHAERLINEPFDEAAFTPRNGATKEDTIKRQIEEAREEWDAGRMDRVDDLCLSPRTGRIVCASFAPEYEPILAVDACDERHLLEMLWRELEAARLVVGFGIWGFDWPYFVMRSAMLGVRPTRPVQPFMRRYSYQPLFDVRMAAANWDMRATGTLSDYAAAFGVSTAQTVSGADVPRLHRENRHDLIAQHCRDDVQETYAIYQRLAPFFLSGA